MLTSFQAEIPNYFVIKPNEIKELFSQLPNLRLLRLSKFTIFQYDQGVSQGLDQLRVSTEEGLFDLACLYSLAATLPRLKT